MRVRSSMRYGAVQVQILHRTTKEDDVATSMGAAAFSSGAGSVGAASAGAGSAGAASAGAGSAGAGSGRGYNYTVYYRAATGEPTTCMNTTPCLTG